MRPESLELLLDTDIDETLVWGVVESSRPEMLSSARLAPRLEMTLRE